MTISHQWIPQIDPRRCNGCQDCIALCPTQALGVVEGKAAVIRPQACNYCAACESACPTHAIALPYQIGFAPDARRSHPRADAGQ